ALGRQRIVGAAREVAGQEFRRVDDNPRRAGLDRAEHFLRAGDDDVAAEHEIGAARGDADGVDFLRRVSDADIAVDRAALLREAGHVDDADALAFEVCRHRGDRADGDDAGAADAGDDDAVRVIGLRQGRRSQRRPTRRLGYALTLLQLRAMHGNEGRAKAVETGIVLVAARLVDGALAAPFGHQRLYGNAVRFHAAVAAAFADEIVDDDALVRIREQAAL